MAQQDKDKKTPFVEESQVPVTVPSQYPCPSSSLPVEQRWAFQETADVAGTQEAGVTDVPQAPTVIGIQEAGADTSEILQAVGIRSIHQAAAMGDIKQVAGVSGIQPVPGTSGTQQVFDFGSIQEAAGPSGTQRAATPETPRFLRPETPKVPEILKSNVDEKKPRRLKNRRGSNASLTIDVSYNPESKPFSTSPTVEESSEDILCAASHLLTKTELRDALNDIQSLHTEFWQIPMNHPEKPVISGCGTKNRYETILPNEKTRVKLTDSEEPDSYINANYIRGYKKEEKVYIATQGPLSHTIRDFYRMIWKENCPIIVMITKFFEKKEKCECYFPAETNKTEVFAEFQVTVIKIEERDGYSVREFLLQSRGETRKIWHYWCDSWADHQIPDDPRPIISLVREISGNSNSKLGPIVVHCSAGIGRTGCFIAICVGMAQLLDVNKVDILGIVSQLRCDRGGMVQTADQYVFVHQAVAEFALTLPEPLTD